MKTVLENKILDKKEFVDDFSVRAIKINQVVLNDPQKKINKGEIISIGFHDILVK
jgi:hypothetical protein